MVCLLVVVGCIVDGGLGGELDVYLDGEWHCDADCDLEGGLGAHRDGGWESDLD